MSAQEELLKQVRESIEKSLPAIQVDVFKKYVEESEATKKTYEELKTDYEALRVKNLEATRELSALRGLKMEEDSIKRERANLDVDKKIFEIEKKLIEEQRKSATEKVDLLRGVMDTIFRNTEVKRSIYDTRPVVLKDTCGYERVEQHTTSHEEVETKH